MANEEHKMKEKMKEKEKNFIAIKIYEKTFLK
jgi:hypothetical protein